MDVQNYFSETYLDAREKFLGACTAAGLEPEGFVHPEPGPGGAPLTTDVLRVGPADATRLLVLISGVHGVEAMCGSACQSGWIAEGRHLDLPDNTAVLLVHIINCWGAANLRRNTDGNVDLCRNFMDFDRPLPEQPLYEEVHEALTCKDYDGAPRDKANETLAAFQRDRGMAAFIGALMGGQFKHPNGFSFGGTEPSWSNRTIRNVLSRHAGDARRVALVEYHSGLGPYGYGSAVTMHTGADLDRARRWFGNWIVAPNERDEAASGEFHTVRGHSTEGYMAALPRAEVTSIVLEYGTYPPTVSLPILLDDHWLAMNGDPDSPLGRRIKQKLLEVHHPQDRHWRRAIWDRSLQVIVQALEGLCL